jgi:hypothetical protein
MTQRQEGIAKVGCDSKLRALEFRDDEQVQESPE